MERAKPLPTLPDPDPTAPADARTNVGIEALVEDNASIVKIYNELAIRHNALVDEVLKRLKQAQ